MIRRRMNFRYEDYLKVVEYFDMNINNGVSSISKNLNIRHHTVDYYVNFYLSQKANYMGESVEPPASYFKYKKQILNEPFHNSIRVELYIDKVYFKEFHSIKNIESYLKTYLKKAQRDDLRYSGFTEFYSKKLNKNIKIIKL